MASRLPIAAPLILLAGAGLAHVSQRAADDARRDGDVSQEILLVPNGEVIRVASMDYHLHVADVLWIRTVLGFGEWFYAEMDPGWIEWLQVSIDAVTALDPDWRTPYFYGGVMLRVVGAIDASTAVFTEGAEAMPDDPFFPFSVGMNHYLHDHDPEQAAYWLERAAALPGAPEWYRVAAVAMRERRQERPQAIRYLREEIDNTADPRLRAVLEARLARLVHEEYVDRFEDMRQQFIAQRGAAPEAPEDLVAPGFLKALPEDPLREGWVVDVDGRIRSAAAARDREDAARKAARRMLQYVPR